VAIAVLAAAESVIASSADAVLAAAEKEKLSNTSGRPSHARAAATCPAPMPSPTNRTT